MKKIKVKVLPKVGLPANRANTWFEDGYYILEVKKMKKIKVKVLPKVGLPANRANTWFFKEKIHS